MGLDSFVGAYTEDSITTLTDAKACFSHQPLPIAYLIVAQYQRFQQPLIF